MGVREREREEGRGEERGLFESAECGNATNQKDKEEAKKQQV